MEHRERLAAVSRGGETDRIPWFAWETGAALGVVLEHADRWQPDAVVVSSAEDVTAALQLSAHCAVLMEVQNPFGRALETGVDMNGEFEGGPQFGDNAFTNFFEATRNQIESALNGGADGILYRLFGAEPNLSTPMQFGGLYLEQEREMLSSIADAPFNVLYIEGGEGTYLDVVSDLPAHAFGWDENRMHVSAGEVRSLRHGALACGLRSEDPMWVFKSIGSFGLVLSAKVESLAAADFSDAVTATAALAGVTR
jgi:hypothetical protein